MSRININKPNPHEHTKLVKDLDRKKMLHILHKQFRALDLKTKQQAEEKQRLQDDLLPATTRTPATSSSSSLNRSYSTPEVRTVHTVIDEIKYHTTRQRQHRLIETRNNFSNILETARRQVALVPFSPLKHQKDWRPRARNRELEQTKLDPRDRSSHWKGEFGDQWFERDRKGLQSFLTSPTKQRTRMTRDEFFEACVISTQEKEKKQNKNREGNGLPQMQETSWADPTADGRLQVYDMLVSSDKSSSCVIKRKAWKLLRSDRDSRPILDACPLLTSLAGKSNPRWSGATGHDRPLPKNKITCNLESKLGMISMKSCKKSILRELKQRPTLGITLRQRAIRQEGLSALDFFSNEIHRMRRETPTVLRKEKEVIEHRRLDDLIKRKKQKEQKREESKRMQAEKAKKQAHAMNSMKSRPGTALSDPSLSPEDREEEAAKILQRIGKGFLYNKRKQENKHETDEADETEQK